MSILIPSALERHILGAGNMEARVAVKAFGRADAPSFVILASPYGAAELVRIIGTAVEHAGPEDKPAWKALGLEFTKALLGEMQ